MNLLERIVFNILFNTVLSFISGIAIVVVAIWVCKIKSQAFRLYLYSLPFVKVLIDIFRGVPPDSYIWTDLNFFSLPSNLGGIMSLSTGFSKLGPILALKFGVSDKLRPEQSEPVLYSLSFPDVVYSWITDHVGRHSISVILALVLLISFFLTAYRLIAWVHFELLRIRDRKTSCSLVELKKLGVRSVDIYISSAYSGSPFTGGLFKPYICFPQSTYSLLSLTEREAVIAHEIGHIRHFDLFQSIIVSLMGDLFWFVPFYRMTARKIDIHREILADHYATSTNVSHGALAQALVKLKEFSLSPPKPALYSAFAKSKSTLELRVNLILNRQSEPQFKILRSIYFFSCGLVITGTVLSATFGGNYEIEKSQGMQQQVDGWIKRHLGIE